MAYNACFAITVQYKVRIRFRVTSVTALVQKTKNVLQNLQR